MMKTEATTVRKGTTHYASNHAYMGSHPNEYFTEYLENPPLHPLWWSATYLPVSAHVVGTFATGEFIVQTGTDTYQLWCKHPPLMI